MPDISEIFGSGKLSYDEFLIKAGEAGAKIGDVGELERSYEDKIRTIRVSGALERELERAGVLNKSLITKIIDTEKITVDEDGVSGIAEQLNALRESDPYLFGAQSAQSSQSAGTSAPRQILTGMSHSQKAADPDAMSDVDFYRQIKKM